MRPGIGRAAIRRNRAACQTDGPARALVLTAQAMPNRALANRRPWLLLALIAAIGYYVLMDAPIGGLWLTLIKGAAVGALALYAVKRHGSRDATILAIALGLASLGDMAMRVSLHAGGAVFFAAHCVAIYLFLRNRRDNPAGTTRTLALMLLLITPLVCWLLSQALLPTLYGVALGAMAAAAWLSRFTRYRVGLGAVLFVLSDWLIFVDMRLPAPVTWPDWFIWPLYFAGQFLIATGVVQTLRRETAQPQP